eukprot:8662544-Alexandrium_andersonii.AAC.1
MTPDLTTCIEAHPALLEMGFPALGSLHCKVPTTQSTIRPRPASAAIRLNPQSAVRDMQTRFK